MKKLLGSEKQVSWAEDIRNRYSKTADTLRDILTIYADTTQIEIVDPDPIFGDTIRLEYAAKITPAQEAAIYTAHHWHPEREPGKAAAWTINRGAELAAAGECHADRKAQAEFIAATLAALDAALDTEDARYWIDLR